MAFHTHCTTPPLSEYPKGPWLCSKKHDEIYYQSQDPSNLEFLSIPVLVEVLRGNVSGY
jgi:hypothetical protein